MSRVIYNVEALEGACATCLDGLHWRCGGRRGCKCSNCRQAMSQALRTPTVRPEGRKRGPKPGSGKPKPEPKWHRAVVTREMKDQILHECNVLHRQQKIVAKELGIKPGTISAFLKREREKNETP